MRWLETLVWPGQDDRLARLRHGAEVARRDPPRIVRGHLLDELPALVEAAAAHGTVVVFHSAVAAYLTVEDRARFQRLMTRLVDDGACHWVSNEAPGVFPELVARGPEAARTAHHFVLALDGEVRALTHGHGSYLQWLAGLTVWRGRRGRDVGNVRDYRRSAARTAAWWR
jgi:hypothetical protein